MADFTPQAQVEWTCMKTIGLGGLMGILVGVIFSTAFRFDVFPPALVGCFLGIFAGWGRLVRQAQHAEINFMDDGERQRYASRWWWGRPASLLFSYTLMMSTLGLVGSLFLLMIGSIHQVEVVFALGILYAVVASIRSAVDSALELTSHREERRLVRRQNWYQRLAGAMVWGMAALVAALVVEIALPFLGKWGESITVGLPGSYLVEGFLVGALVGVGRKDELDTKMFTLLRQRIPDILKWSVILSVLGMLMGSIFAGDGKPDASETLMGALHIIFLFLPFIKLAMDTNDVRRES